MDDGKHGCCRLVGIGGDDLRHLVGLGAQELVGEAVHFIRGATGEEV